MGKAMAPLSGSAGRRPHTAPAFPGLRSGCFGPCPSHRACDHSAHEGNPEAQTLRALIVIEEIFAVAVEILDQEVGAEVEEVQVDWHRQVVLAGEIVKVAPDTTAVGQRWAASPAEHSAELAVAAVVSDVLVVREAADVEPGFRHQHEVPVVERSYGP